MFPHTQISTNVQASIQQLVMWWNCTRFTMRHHRHLTQWHMKASTEWGVIKQISTKWSLRMYLFYDYRAMCISESVRCCQFLRQFFCFRWKTVGSSWNCPFLWSTKTFSGSGYPTKKFYLILKQKHWSWLIWTQAVSRRTDELSLSETLGQRCVLISQIHVRSPGTFIFIIKYRRTFEPTDSYLRVAELHCSQALKNTKTCELIKYNGLFSWGLFTPTQKKRFR